MKLDNIKNRITLPDGWCWVEPYPGHTIDDMCHAFMAVALATIGNSPYACRL